MQLSNLPAWVAQIFGQSAGSSYIRTIPVTTSDPAAASHTIGFPPECFTPEGAGGVPPDGRDFNGILNYLAAWANWQGAGGGVPWSSTVASAGGYPKGATVLSATVAGLNFTSSADNNTTNPEASGAANWLATGPMASGTDGGTGISWRSWYDATTGKKMVRMVGTQSFSSESNATVSFGSVFTLGSVFDWGVSTIIPVASGGYDQGAQVIGIPSTTSISLQAQEYGGGIWTWPISARWWVEGYLP